MQVFELTNQGLKLIEIAPGLDLHKDILNQTFKPIIADHLKLIPAFTKKMGELKQFHKEHEVKLKGYTNEFRLDKTRSDFDDDKPAVIDHAKHLGHTNNSMHALIIWHII